MYGSPTLSRSAPPHLSVSCTAPPGCAAVLDGRACGTGPPGMDSTRTGRRQQQQDHQQRQQQQQQRCCHLHGDPSNPSGRLLPLLHTGSLCGTARPPPPPPPPPPPLAPASLMPAGPETPDAAAGPPRMPAPDVILPQQPPPHHQHPLHHPHRQHQHPPQQLAPSSGGATNRRQRDPSSGTSEGSRSTGPIPGGPRDVSAALSPVPARPRPPRGAAAAAAAALLPALLVLLALGGPPGGPAPRLVYGSIYTGTDFPFENCLQEQRHSPYYATMYSYRENQPMNTSTICLQIQVLDTCTPGRFRCCKTSINKLKVFPAPNCRGSVASALINGNTVKSYYWEVHDGFDILKITPLAQWLTGPAAADGAILCLNLQQPCWKVSAFSYNPNLLEYSLYDKKVNNYECCPTGTVLFSPSEPGFPSRPPPARVPPSPPDVPQLPQSPRLLRPPPLLTKAKKSPPPSPPNPPPPRPPPPSQPSPPPPKAKRSPPPPPPPPNPPPPPPNPPPPSPPPPSSPPQRSPPPPPPLRSPPPSPPSPPPPKKRPPPPPAVPPPGCDVTVVVRRFAAPNQGFTDTFCELFGTLVLLPLNQDASSPPASYNCAISDPSNMVLTITLPTSSDARQLLTLYGDPTQRQIAIPLLGLSDCASDFATLSSSCVGDVAPVIVNCPITLPSPPPPKKRSPPPPPLTIARLASPPPPSPPASPPPAPAPRILLSDSSAYLLYGTPATFTVAEQTCVNLGGHLASIGSEEEFGFLSGSILSGLSGSTPFNVWFGLTIRTDAGAAIPGYNTDGSRLSYMPDDFQYDRTRAAVRYYMLTCAAAAGGCGYRYSPGGAADVQPAFVCEFAS